MISGQMAKFEQKEALRNDKRPAQKNKKKAKLNPKVALDKMKCFVIVFILIVQMRAN